MSKYDELASLAAKFSHTIFDNQKECQRLAGLIVRGYADYLGCSLKNVQFVKLDGELRPTDQISGFEATVPVVLDGAGFWHFCTRIQFEGPDPRASAHEVLKLAVKFTDGLLTIREEQDFNADPAKPESFLPLFDYLYEMSRTGFSTPLVKQSKRIGFLG